MSPSKIIRRYIVLICPRCGSKEKYPEKAFGPEIRIHCSTCLWREHEITELEPYDPEKHRPPWQAPANRKA